MPTVADMIHKLQTEFKPTDVIAYSLFTLADMRNAARQVKLEATDEQLVEAAENIHCGVSRRIRRQKCWQGAHRGTFRGSAISKKGRAR